MRRWYCSFIYRWSFGRGGGGHRCRGVYLHHGCIRAWVRLIATVSACQCLSVLVIIQFSFSARLLTRRPWHFYCYVKLPGHMTILAFHQLQLSLEHEWVKITASICSEACFHIILTTRACHDRDSKPRVPPVRAQRSTAQLSIWSDGL